MLYMHPAFICISSGHLITVVSSTCINTQYLSVSITVYRVSIQYFKFSITEAGTHATVINDFAVFCISIHSQSLRIQFPSVNHSSKGDGQV